MSIFLQPKKTKVCPKCDKRLDYASFGFFRKGKEKVVNSYCTNCRYKLQFEVEELHTLKLLLRKKRKKLQDKKISLTDYTAYKELSFKIGQCIKQRKQDE